MKELLEFALESLKKYGEHDDDDWCNCASCRMGMRSCCERESESSTNYNPRKQCPGGDDCTCELTKAIDAIKSGIANA